MARATKLPIDPDDAPLKRLGGGRWQTRDERFTIEPQSGTWVVVDGEQTDDLGMALVRGPFPSLTAAKDAIASARSSAPAASPLAERIERRRREPQAERKPTPAPTAHGKPARPASGSGGELAAKHEAKAGTVPPSTATSDRRARPARDEPEEPGWITDLEPAERGRARRLIALLRDDGVADAEGLVRRDLVGDVPALAAAAIGGRRAERGADAKPNEVAELLAEGRDERLGVRWRLVDGDGRPILLEAAARRRR
jgi:hypothetical protein